MIAETLLFPPKECIPPNKDDACLVLNVMPESQFANMYIAFGYSIISSLSKIVIKAKNMNIFSRLGDGIHIKPAKMTKKPKFSLNDNIYKMMLSYLTKLIKKSATNVKIIQRLNKLRLKLSFKI